MLDTVIIGGGASGFFCANIIKNLQPNHKFIILEKTSKTLTKVKISGGGRCNVTNSITLPKALSKNYPRGEKFLLSLFKEFGSNEVWDWFNERGANLKKEADGRVFPSSNSSQTIIDILRKAINEEELKINFTVQQIKQKGANWLIKGEKEVFEAKNIVIASGRLSKKKNMISHLQIDIVPPIPSLFTFTTSSQKKLLDHLQGVSIKKTSIKVLGTKLQSEGPLLFTHWGISGPVVLKLSSWGARKLNEKNYNFSIHINFTKNSFDDTKSIIEKTKISSPKKKLINLIPFEIPKKVWNYILDSSGISVNETYENISGKKLNKLVTQVSQFELIIDGKSTYKEEFVTAGGIDLAQISKNSCEHRKYSGLYFAGEVMDIDAITGGFNFQAAWTTAYTVAKNITKN